MRIPLLSTLPYNSPSIIPTVCSLKSLYARRFFTTSPNPPKVQPAGRTGLAVPIRGVVVWVARQSLALETTVTTTFLGVLPSGIDRKTKQQSSHTLTAIHFSCPQLLRASLLWRREKVRFWIGCSICGALCGTLYVPLSGRPRRVLTS